MIYGSVCSGIEAPTQAWHPIGWKPSFFSEIDEFPRAVLQHHYPDVPCHGDFTTIEEDSYEPIDLLVGGTPCQSFSIAGLRAGLSDDRGNLALEYLRLADRLSPRWVVWENVPGVLSSGGGRDFGSFLGALAELGYGFAYRVLDAQFFGVAQRRRRVFVIGYLGDYRRAAAVLFEPESLRRDSSPREKSEKDLAPTLVGGAPFSRTGNERVECDAVVTVGALDTECGMSRQTHQTLNAGHYVIENPITGTLTTRTQVALGVRDVEEGALISFQSNMSEPETANDLSVTLKVGGKGGNPPAVAFAQNSRDEVREMPYAGALAARLGAKQQSYIRQGMAVRRLTPVECERLQGFPDDFTRIPYRNKTIERCPDSPRYKALGNSMAVPVMAWIGKRIQMVEEEL